MEGVLKALQGFTAGTEKKAAAASDKTALQLRREIQNVSQRLKELEGIFNCVGDDELIDAMIYEELSLQSRYRYLLRLARENNIACKGEVFPLEKEDLCRNKLSSGRS